MLTEQMYYFRAADFGPVILDAQQEMKQRTAMVLGLVRGGASMLGAVLDALGVYMGPPKELQSGGTYENFRMRDPDAKIREAEIEACNSNYDVWGWKTSPGWQVVPNLPSSVRNPHGIWIYRCPLAVASRRKLSQPEDADRLLSEIIVEVLQEYAKLTQCLNTQGIRRMLVSYQWSIQRPETLISSLCEFLAISPTVAQFTNAIRRINPKGGYYHTAPKAAGPAKMRRLLARAMHDSQNPHFWQQIQECLEETKEWE